MTPTTTDPANKLRAELIWLQLNPQFAERPATLLEFLGPDYLNCEKYVRASIKRELSVIFGKKVGTRKPTAFPLAMITGAIGIGKQQPVHSKVLTPKGWLPIGSLEVGDRVIGSTGSPTTVVGVYPQGVKPNYRITTTDGATVLAGPDHRWQVQDVRRKSKGHGPCVMTTQELIDAGLTVGHQRRWQIPVMSGPVAYEASPRLPVRPWTIGALLGDGGLTSGVKFSTADPEMLDRLRQENPGIIFKKINACDWRLVTDRGQENPLLTAIRRLGMCVRSESKRIPETYLMASSLDRLELLRGLMDTDGFQSTFNHTSFTSASQGLANDVVSLVRSLGGIATRPKFKANDSLGGWSTTIKMRHCPYWLDRKQERWSPRSKNPIVRSIDTIEYEAEFESVCIMVDAADGLYVTEDFLLTHNTTIASIVLPYLVHWLLCLKDPQDFFSMLPGSRIALMQMSTSEQQAREVVFGDIKARIAHSPWFGQWRIDPNYKNQIRFIDKDIWIIPGDSAETTFEGYNILGGILDEADSHQLTKNKDYAEQGYSTIDSRISSRFDDRGFLLVIGQMKSNTGFAARKYRDMRSDPNAYAVSLTIWESLGSDHYRKPDGSEGETFFYDTKRKQIVPTQLANAIQSDSVIEIPMVYYQQFSNNPEKALRDLAGIPPSVGSAFIGMTHKIEECRDRWVARYGDIGSPVNSAGGRIELAPWFFCRDNLKRVAHVDIAYSAEGDGLGFAMGHVAEVLTVDGEMKPLVVVDLVMRMHAPTGGAIMLSDVRQFIYGLKTDRKFNIVKVTTDGFQSTDFIQQLQRRRFDTEVVSVDRVMLPYEDLREAIYENRIEFPPYFVKLRPSDTQEVEITIKELSELQYAGPKVDHPLNGSKDVSDALAGVTYTLMGDRQYRRNVRDISSARTARQQEQVAVGFGNASLHPAYLGDRRSQAPVPPTALALAKGQRRDW